MPFARLMSALRRLGWGLRETVEVLHSGPLVVPRIVALRDGTVKVILYYNQPLLDADALIRPGAWP